MADNRKWWYRDNRITNGGKTMPGGGEGIQTMGRQWVLTISVIIVVAAGAEAVRRSSAPPELDLYPEVVYFARHLNTRLEDSSFRRRGWGMDRLRLEVRQMKIVFQTNNLHEDLLKEAVDVAVAAMMAAHTEGRK